MMNLEDFLNNYMNIGLNPYIVLNDNEPLLLESDTDSLEVLSISNPLVGKYIKEKKLVLQKNDWKKYTGYFIKCAKNSFGNAQTCFLTPEEGLEQRVQNIIVVEEGGHLELFTGCLSGKHVKGNIHRSVTDIFVGENATLIFNMIHSWGSTSKVYPNVKVHVAKGGKYISNYIVWEKVKEIISNPTVEVDDGGQTILNSLSYIHPKSNMDLGGNIKLLGKDSVGEIHSSAVNGGGDFVTNTILEGVGDNSKGHIDCNALLLTDGAKVTAIPQLFSKNSNTQLTHEAFLGKVSSEEIEYLQTKGFSHDDAEEIVVKGFVNKSIEGMPEKVQERMLDILEKAKLGF